MRAVADLGELLLRDAGIHFQRSVVASADIAFPIERQAAHRRSLFELQSFFLRGIQLLAHALNDGRGVDAGFLGVNLPSGRMGFDFPVAQRLGNRGIVHLAVPVPAVADEIDHDGRAECVAIIERDPAHPNDGLKILGIDVENRNGQALRDIGTKPRRVAVARRGGKPDQIIDDDVHGTADVIAGQLRHIQSLGPDALAGERRIAVHGDFEHLLAPLRPAALLLGARAAHGNRIDGFEVAGIGNQMHLDLLSVSGKEIACGAHMVFHVAAAQDAPRIDILEARENLGGRAAHDVHHHIQPPAVAHRQHALFGAVFGSGAENGVEKRKKRGFTFERKAFCAEIARLNRLLENFRLDQEFENALRDPRAWFPIPCAPESRGGARDRGCA